MPPKRTRIFTLLLLLTVGILLSVFSWDDLAHTFSWPSSKPVTGEPELTESELAFEKKYTAYIRESLASTHRHATAPETPMSPLTIASFSKMPEWAFDDEYNLDPSPRQTTCAQSLRNSADESFREAFIPNTRLFMDKDILDMKEWNRLSHFNSPFGFMGFKYDDVMSTAKMITKPKEPLLSPLPGSNGCISCAVVGTAGILNGSRMGKEIDSHDYVFRMNGAIVKGYEEDVGNRTSVYVHTAHSITTSLYLLRKYGYKAAPHDEGIKYVLIPEGMRDFQWLKGLLNGDRVTEGPYRNKRPRTYYSGKYNETNFYVLHQDFLRYVRNRFLKSANLNRKYWAIVRPTNGAFALFTALHTCDIVHAYGFMTEDFRKYSNYYVEKHVKTNIVFYANHDYMLEMNMWKKLHDTKIMKLYQRTG
ncbi:alpha-N-acetylgalactosaminide alpha-2,6-sialyltransferase 1.1 [Neosynchiropus ocellatus]